MVHGGSTEIDMRLALFLILMITLSFQASCFDFADAPETVLAEQGTNIVLVFMLTVMLIASAYMIGRTINKADYIVFAKDEAYHLGFSMVALLGIGGVLIFSCLATDMFYESLFENLSSELSEGCYDSPGQGMNVVSGCYMNKMKKFSAGMSESYIDHYIEELMESTFTYNIQIPLLTSYSSTAGAFRKVVSNQYDIINNSFLIPALMSISMQKLALDFINENVLRWILPVAFLLRVFIPTRSMGNVLIALVLGLYVIVPFMYVFNFAMNDAVSGDCHLFSDAVCDYVVDSGDCANTCGNPDGFWNVGRLIPQAFFLPNLTIAILVTFMTSINKALRVIG